MSRQLTIAIDGPAGAGKSTIAQRLAEVLRYTNLESGAMYRALGLKALERGVGLEDEDELAELAEHSRIELEPTERGNRVLLDGRDVSARIRQADVTDAASRVSVHARVRTQMVDLQRQIGAGGGVVMEGRDIGTKVFPHAEIKVFLEACPQVRARRRLLQEEGGTPDPGRVEAVAEQIRERDERDRNRAVSPLVAAPDAITVDSSTLTVDEVLKAILDLVRDKLRDLSTAARME